MGSAILYLPVYVAALPKQLLVAPKPDIVMQAVFQGVFVSVVAVFAFNRSRELLGPVVGATLPAVGLGVVALDEAASARDLASATLIGVGVALTLAGHAPGRWPGVALFKRVFRDA